MSHRKFGAGVETIDQGSGYTLGKARHQRAYRVALRMSAGASLDDFHRVKRAAVKQLGRLVARAGEVYDEGRLTEREYFVDGRPVWELCWSHKSEGSVDRVGDGARGAPLAVVDAGGGGADAGGAGG